MPSATIKLFLPYGDPSRVRTAEISNWTGKAVAAPRSDLEELLRREETSQCGVYLLFGTDPETGRPACYIGEAEVIRDRIKQHRSRDFWVQAIAVVSKDANLTKAHVRYLEGRLIEEATAAARMSLLNSASSGARLPESDREDMEVFLANLRQLLPVLGSDVLVPVLQPGVAHETLLCEIKGLVARGRRTTTGFVVLEGSQAVTATRPSATVRHGWVLDLRERLISEGTLVAAADHLVFSTHAEFSSPSAAAGVVQGGAANGLTAWRTGSGVTLRQLEEQTST